MKIAIIEIPAKKIEPYIKRFGEWLMGNNSQNLKSTEDLE